MPGQPGASTPPIAPRWFTPAPSGDPYAHSLATLAATVALELALPSLGPLALGGGPSGGGLSAAPAPAPYSADGLELMLRHQLLTM